MKKNDKIPLKIDTVTLSGDGIGRYEGMAVFVPGTATGDEIIAHIIKVNKKYAVGKLFEIITPSNHRKELDCSVFAKCGGCAFRHIDYPFELSLKENAVKDAINRIGGVELEPKPITPSPKITGYRNKAQYPITSGEEGIVFGFYARHSHRVVESEDCLLQPEIFKTALKIFKSWADEYNVTAYNETTGTGVLRHLLLRFAESSGELMVVPVVNCDKLPFEKELVEAFLKSFKGNLLSIQYNVNKNDTNVILGDKTVPLWGNEFITDTLCGVKLAISPKSFYQVNKGGAEVLYKKAAAYIKDDDRVIIDLYCGIGSIGLSVLNLTGKDKKLYGVEIVPEAIKNAKYNAETGGFKTAEFFCGDALEAAETLRKKGIRPDVVVVDPPRKGCDSQLIETVANGFEPKKLIYISCDPGTLARDSKILSENGYILEEYSPVDLFPGTAHTETVALFSRR